MTTSDGAPRRLPRRVLALLAITIGLLAGCSKAPETVHIRLATTTSANETGLLPEVLVPAFTKETGIAVDVVAKGTGEALKLGERGDADVVIVHSRKAEDAFLAKGFGVERRDGWWNRFVIVGPADDPAHAGTSATASAALLAIRDAKATFVSRGDDSGTHKREKDLWGVGFAAWTPGYVESGQGMGPTLTIADEKNGYTLCDEGTLLKMRSRLRLRVVFQGDPALANPYGAILVRPDPRRPEAHAAARRFFEWVTSEKAFALVRSFTIEGERPFFLPGEVPPARR